MLMLQIFILVCKPLDCTEVTLSGHNQDVVVVKMVSVIAYSGRKSAKRNRKCSEGKEGKVNFYSFKGRLEVCIEEDWEGLLRKGNCGLIYREV